MTRKPTDQRFMELAHIARDWGTCDRARVGAIVARGGEIVSLGFNGAPPKQPHCDDIGVGHLMISGHCVRTLHAESNALWLAGRDKTKGATLYTTHFPCYSCAKEIVRAGIVRVVYDKSYRIDDLAMELLLANCQVDTVK